LQSTFLINISQHHKELKMAAALSIENLLCMECCATDYYNDDKPIRNFSFRHGDERRRLKRTIALRHPWRRQPHNIHQEGFPLLVLRQSAATAAWTVCHYMNEILFLVASATLTFILFPTIMDRDVILEDIESTRQELQLELLQAIRLHQETMQIPA
jgi:hypothetical protein